MYSLVYNSLSLNGLEPPTSFLNLIKISRILRPILYFAPRSSSDLLYNLLNELTA